MTTDDLIRNEKLKCDIKREAAKQSALSPGKIAKHEYRWKNITIQKVE